jgi:NAD-dependent SIR2 family protein deacetylase
MSYTHTQCTKCHNTIRIDEYSEPDNVYCDECWEDLETNMDQNDPNFYDYMSYSDADSGL